MDKINFANQHTPYQELLLARWYTISCTLLTLMLIGMSSTSFLQWRRYQKALQLQKRYFAHDALMEEYTSLEAQRSATALPYRNPSNAKNQLTALSQNLGKELRLVECTIAADGAHTLTVTAPSRQRIQECISALNQKKTFGTLAVTSLKTVQNGEKTHLLVMIKARKS